MGETGSGANEHSHYEAIGQLTSRFANMEFLLHAVAWRLINDDEGVGRIVTSDMKLYKLEELVKELARYKYGEGTRAREQFEAVVGKVKDAREKRNRIFHSMWLEDAANEGQVTMVRLKRGAVATDPSSTEHVRSVDRVVMEVIEELFAALLAFDANAWKSDDD